MNRLTSADEAERARVHLSRLLGARGEWLLREGRAARCCELRRGEWELRVAGGALVLSYRGESGARSWRVSAWRAEGASLFLEASQRAGARRALLGLVPRASVASARNAVADARRAECERLAAVIARAAGARLERATLSQGARRGEPGRWARVLLRGAGGARLATTAPVVPVGAEAAEAFLSSALLWHARLEEGSRSKGARAGGVGGLWLVAPPPLAAALRERAPLLRESLRALVAVYELNEEARGALPALTPLPSLTPLPALTPLNAPTLEELLDAPARRLARAAAHAPSRLAETVIALAPSEIDRVRARKGETLRYLGLPFARVREVAGREHLWFGVGASRRRALFDERSAPDFFKLVEELKEHRRAGARDRRHALYRAAPEAWLEAMLRRDVTRLDPGLRLAPIHAQFRAAPAYGASAPRPVDLLALRRDGRLVVVELKVSEDAALALQGADYWRLVEARRRRGDIERARLFGDAQLSDEPTLVYLAAPMLRFHRSFDALARCVRPEVEMYRFDLNEDWRSGVRVARRATLNVN